MDKPKLEISQSGIYVRGIVVSNNASAFNRKDGSGVTVRVTHELAVQPGVVTLSRFIDPKEDPTLKLDGLTVLEFPKMKEFSNITVKALRMNQDRDRTVISSWEPVN